MADTKLSALTATGGVLDADLVYTVTGGASKKATVAQLRVQTDTSSAGVAKAISTLAAAQTASTTAGVGLTITADNAVAGSTNAGAAAGGNVTITAGNAARLTSGNANGGNISLVAGTGIGTGTPGQVIVPVGTNSPLNPGIAFSGFSTSGFMYQNGCTTILDNAIQMASFDEFDKGIRIPGDATYGFSNNNNSYNGTSDVGIRRLAANVIAFSSGHALDTLGWSVDAGIKRVSSQFDKSNSAALADIPGLSVALINGRTYSFEACLYTTSNSASGVQAAIAFSAAVTSIRYEGSLTNSNTVGGQVRATASGTAVANVTAVTAATIWISGTITAGAAGNLTVQFAQNVSGGTASSVLTGSYFVVRDNP